MRGRFPERAGGRAGGGEGAGLEAPFRTVAGGVGNRLISGAQGKRNCGRLGAPGPLVDESGIWGRDKEGCIGVVPGPPCQ